jgi:predicted dehydrogenase
MPWIARAAHAGASESIRIGVIGCGGRGTGAAVNALEANPATRIVAMADLFADRLESSRSQLRGREAYSERVDVPDSRAFAGFEAYDELLRLNEVDSVILATPPHFRPIHFEAAVSAGKHVFMEKPVAVDPVGVRRVIAAGDLADQKGLNVVSGTQRRHEACYLALMEQIESGRIGDVISAQCYWNQGGLWVHERKPEYSDMEWQCRNWLYFTWLSGDHICEQHIHNLDVMNWVMGGPPASCMGMGGRQVRTEPEYGNIFDHFAIEYEYPNGEHVQSMCRQIDGCSGKVEEVVHGTSGRSTSRSGQAFIEGERPWRFTGDNRNPYVAEHEDLYRAVLSGSRINEARRVAESTLTAIMGRMSTYTGKTVTWEQAMESELDLSPPAYEFGTLPMRPVAVPGRTPLI